MGCTNYFSNKTQAIVSKIFGKIGYNAYVHPCLYVFHGLLLTIVATLGLLNLEFESDGVRLWVPADSEVISNYDQVIDYFGEFETQCVMIISTKNGDNILTPTNLDGLFDLFLYVSQQVSAKHRGARFYYDQLCLRDYPSYPICEANETNIFALYENNATNWATQEQIDSNLESSFGQVLAELLLADTSVNETTQVITGGSILRIVWGLSSTVNDTIYEANRKFMLKFQDFLADFKKSDVYKSNSDIFDELELTYLTSRSFDDEIDRLVFADIPIYITTFVIMFIYLALNLGDFNCIGARCWIAVVTLTIMLFALLSGYGIGCAIGLKMNSVVLLIPYLLIGVGVDDEILIIEAIDRIPNEISLNGKHDIRIGAERFAHALQHCGLSITLTTFCSIGAFAVGTNVSMPGVSAFCAFAAFCFATNYILQFLIFLPLFALDEQRKLARRNFCCWCFKHGHDAEQTASIINQGADLEDNNNSDDNDEDNGATSRHQNQEGSDHRNGFLKYVSVLSLMKYIVIPVLSKRLYRLLLVALFTILFIVSIISLEWLKVESDNKRLVPDDSYTIDYLDAQEKGYGTSTIETVDLILNRADFSNADTRDNIHDMLDEIESYKDGSDTFAIGYVDEWLSDFEIFIKNITNGNVNDLNRTQFYSYLQVFANTTEYIEWANEILYDNNDKPTKIKSTKFYIDFQLPVSLRDQWILRNDLTDIIKDYIKINNNDATGYAFRFQWPYAYFEWSIVELTVGNIVSASIGVFLILCFMMDIKMACFIIIVVVMIDMELFGWMVLFNVSLDSITFLQLVMAVGLTVDYVIHISHALAECEPESEEEEEELEKESGSQSDSKDDDNDEFNKRIVIGMSEMGVGVVKGAWTTFLGVLALSASSSAAFRGFFALFAGIIIVAVTNGLFFVPSVMAELKCLYKNNSDEKNNNNSENDENAGTTDTK